MKMDAHALSRKTKAHLLMIWSRISWRLFLWGTAMALIASVDSQQSPDSSETSLATIQSDNSKIVSSQVDRQQTISFPGTFPIIYSTSLATSATSSHLIISDGPLILVADNTATIPSAPQLSSSLLYGSTNFNFTVKSQLNMPYQPETVSSSPDSLKPFNISPIWPGSTSTDFELSSIHPTAVLSGSLGAGEISSGLDKNSEALVSLTLSVTSENYSPLLETDVIRSSLKEASLKSDSHSLLDSSMSLLVYSKSQSVLIEAFNTVIQTTFPFQHLNASIFDTTATTYPSSVDTLRFSTFDLNAINSVKIIDSSFLATTTFSFSEENSIDSVSAEPSIETVSLINPTPTRIPVTEVSNDRTALVTGASPDILSSDVMEISLTRSPGSISSMEVNEHFSPTSPPTDGSEQTVTVGALPSHDVSVSSLFILSNGSQPSEIDGKSPEVTEERFASQTPVFEVSDSFSTLFPTLSSGKPFSMHARESILSVEQQVSGTVLELTSLFSGASFSMHQILTSTFVFMTESVSYTNASYVDVFLDSSMTARDMSMSRYHVSLLRSNTDLVSNSFLESQMAVTIPTSFASINEFSQSMNMIESTFSDFWLGINGSTQTVLNSDVVGVGWSSSLDLNKSSFLASSFVKLSLPPDTELNTEIDTTRDSLTVYSSQSGSLDNSVPSVGEPLSYFQTLAASLSSRVSEGGESFSFIEKSDVPSAASIFTYIMLPDSNNWVSTLYTIITTPLIQSTGMVSDRSLVPSDTASWPESISPFQVSHSTPEMFETSDIVIDSAQSQESLLDSKLLGANMTIDTDVSSLPQSIESTDVAGDSKGILLTTVISLLSLSEISHSSYAEILQSEVTGLTVELSSGFSSELSQAFSMIASETSEIFEWNTKSTFSVIMISPISLLDSSESFEPELDTVLSTMSVSQLSPLYESATDLLINPIASFTETVSNVNLIISTGVEWTDFSSILLESFSQFSASEYLNLSVTTIPNFSEATGSTSGTVIFMFTSSAVDSVPVSTSVSLGTADLSSVLEHVSAIFNETDILTPDFLSSEFQVSSDTTMYPYLTSVQGEISSGDVSSSALLLLPSFLSIETMTPSMLLSTFGLQISTTEPASLEILNSTSLDFTATIDKDYFENATSASLSHYGWNSVTQPDFMENTTAAMPSASVIIPSKSSSNVSIELSSQMNPVTTDSQFPISTLVSLSLSASVLESVSRNSSLIFNEDMTETRADLGTSSSEWSLQLSSLIEPLLSWTDVTAFTTPVPHSETRLTVATSYSDWLLQFSFSIQPLVSLAEAASFYSTPNLHSQTKPDVETSYSEWSLELPSLLESVMSSVNITFITPNLSFDFNQTVSTFEETTHLPRTISSLEHLTVSFDQDPSHSTTETNETTLFWQTSISFQATASSFTENDWNADLSHTILYTRTDHLFNTELVSFDNNQTEVVSYMSSDPTILASVVSVMASHANITADVVSEITPHFTSLPFPSRTATILNSSITSEMSSGFVQEYETDSLFQTQDLFPSSEAATTFFSSWLLHPSLSGDEVLSSKTWTTWTPVVLPSSLAMSTEPFPSVFLSSLDSMSQFQFHSPLPPKTSGIMAEVTTDLQHFSQSSSLFADRMTSLQLHSMSNIDNGPESLTSPLFSLLPSTPEMSLSVELTPQLSLSYQTIVLLSKSEVSASISSLVLNGTLETSWLFTFNLSSVPILQDLSSEAGVPNDTLKSSLLFSTELVSLSIFPAHSSETGLLHDTLETSLFSTAQLPSLPVIPVGTESFLASLSTLELFSSLFTLFTPSDEMTQLSSYMFTTETLASSFADTMGANVTSDVTMRLSSQSAEISSISATLSSLHFEFTETSELTPLQTLLTSFVDTFTTIFTPEVTQASSSPLLEEMPSFSEMSISSEIFDISISDTFSINFTSEVTQASSSSSQLEEDNSFSEMSVSSSAQLEQSPTFSDSSKQISSESLYSRSLDLESTISTSEATPSFASSNEESSFSPISDFLSQDSISEAPALSVSIDFSSPLVSTMYSYTPLFPNTESTLDILSSNQSIMMETSFSLDDAVSETILPSSFETIMSESINAVSTVVTTPVVTISQSSSSPSMIEQQSTVQLLQSSFIIEASSPSLESSATSMIPTSSALSPISSTTATTLVTLTTATATATSSSTTTVPINENKNNTMFWVVTGFRVRLNIDVQTEEFKGALEKGLANCYYMARVRREEMKNDTYVPLHRRKRQSSADGDAGTKVDVSVEDPAAIIVSAERKSNTPSVEVIHVVEENGQMLTATIATQQMKLLSDQEVAILTGHVVSWSAKPYVAPASKSDDSVIWIIVGCVVGGVVLITIIIIIVCLCCCGNHCGKRAETDKVGMADMPESGQPKVVEVGKSSDGYVEENTKTAAPVAFSARKGKYSINVGQEEEEEEDPLYAQVNKKAPTKAPRKNRTNSQTSAGKQVATVENEEEEGGGSTKKTKKRKKQLETDEDLRSVYESQIASLNTTATQMAHSQKSYTLSSQPTIEDENDLLENAEEERRKNKQRLRAKKVKENEHNSPVKSGDQAENAYKNAQKEIDKILAPREEEDETRKKHRDKGKKKKEKEKRGEDNEAFSGDEKKEESLEEARHRMHRLLDDAFSLISHSKSSLGNRVEPVRVGSNEENSGRSEKSISARSDHHVQTEIDVRIEKMHTPVHVHRTYGPYDKDGLITWSPYRAADESSLISLPTAQPNLDRVPPQQEKTVTTTFNENLPDSMKSNYYATEPGEPIIIKTKGADSKLSPTGSRSRRGSHSSTNGRLNNGTVNSVTKQNPVYDSIVPSKSMNYDSNSYGLTSYHESPGGLEDGRPLQNGSMSRRYKDIRRSSNSATSGTNLAQQDGHVQKHTAPQKGEKKNLDEVDVIKESLKPGASPQPFIQSLRDELQTLSNKKKGKTSRADNSGTILFKTNGSAPAQSSSGVESMPKENTSEV